MAIDDNTSYELTGYQVKDLAGRIRRKADASAIPTVNDATLTLVQNGTTVGTFTANQSTNTTVNLAGGIYADDPTTSANPDGWITSGDVDWSNFGSAIKKFSMPAVSNTSAGSWTSVQLGSAQNVSGLDPNGSYIIIAVDSYAESIGAVGEFQLEATGTTTVAMNSYHSDSLESVSFLLGPVKPKSTGVLTFKRYYRGDTATVRCSTTEGVIIRVG